MTFSTMDILSFSNLSRNLSHSDFMAEANSLSWPKSVLLADPSILPRALCRKWKKSVDSLYNLFTRVVGFVPSISASITIFHTQRVRFLLHSGLALPQN